MIPRPMKNPLLRLSCLRTAPKPPASDTDSFTGEVTMMNKIINVAAATEMKDVKAKLAIS
jgi:hypothetical protein